MNTPTNETSRQSGQNQKENGFSLTLLIVLMIAVTVACVIFGLVAYHSLDSWTERGQFGDMFGALNTMFSALAFAGVIYAIVLQRQELALQREELRLSREELAAQNKIVSAQLQTMQESLGFERDKERLSAAPVFRVHKSSGSQGWRHFVIHNHGGRITNVQIGAVAPSTVEIIVSPSEVWDSNAEGTIEVEDFDENTVSECHFEISFIDRLGNSSSKWFKLIQPRELTVLPSKPK